MLPFYPAQSRIVKVIIKLISFIFKMPTLDQSRLSMANELYQEGFVVRHVFLEKKGVRYSGLLIGHKNTITNGNWVLQATGNLEFIEDSAHLFSRIYNQYGFNTLLVNGPCVGRSEGEATPETMGDAQEAGLSFIETALRAKRVVIAGRSLGGAAVGLAIKKHEFKKCIHYLVVRQMTFDRASNIGGKRIGQQSPNLERHVANTIKWAGCEMDSIAASERLVQLKIKEVIIQASNRAIERGVLPTANDFHTDGPILAEASLGHGLIQKRLTDDKVFLCLPSAGHMAPETITAAEQELLELLNVLP
jgi:hypothetical protein